MTNIDRSDLREILLLIQLHHNDNPDHGLNCACLDEWIGQIRRMTTVSDKGAQRRIDYVLRSACENRT